MTLNVTVPDSVYRQIAEFAARQQVSGWNRVQHMAELGNRERFLAALDKVPAAEPTPEDQL